MMPNSHIEYSDYSDTKFRTLLNANGYVYLNGIPQKFNHVEFFQKFGNLIPQYDGKLVWSIRAEDKYKDTYHSLNNKPLKPHTECHELPGKPPQYLALWCIVRASDGGGQTTLADMNPFFARLTPEELQHLSSKTYTFVSTLGLQQMELGNVAQHPLYERSNGSNPIFRFSYDGAQHRDDPSLLDMRERVVKFFEDEHVAIDIEPNAVLMWNNHRVLHARTGYADMRRHLRRVWLS
jgi:TfdA family taurine catabolism dioxygenase TauD